jgi:hypothetical protein
MEVDQPGEAGRVNNIGFGQRHIQLVGQGGNCRLGKHFSLLKIEKYFVNCRGYRGQIYLYLLWNLSVPVSQFINFRCLLSCFCNLRRVCLLSHIQRHCFD